MAVTEVPPLVPITAPVFAVEVVGMNRRKRRMEYRAAWIPKLIQIGMTYQRFGTKISKAESQPWAHVRIPK